MFRIAYYKQKEYHQVVFFYTKVVCVLVLYYVNDLFITFLCTELWMQLSYHVMTVITLYLPLYHDYRNYRLPVCVNVSVKLYDNKAGITEQNNY